MPGSSLSDQPARGRRLGLAAWLARLCSLAVALVAVAVAAPAPGVAAASAPLRRRQPQAPPPTPAQEMARTVAGTEPAPGPVLAKGPLVWAAPVGVDAHPINGLDCPSASLCVGVDSNGDVVTSTDPLGSARDWQTTNVDANNTLTAISCPTVSLCVAVDGAGNEATSGNPGGPGAAWTVGRVDTSISEPSPYGGGLDLLRGVSCPSVALCVAVDSVGNAVLTGIPAAGAGTWVTYHVDANSDYGCAGGGLTCQAPLMGVACPSVSQCDAVDFTGNILQTTTPTADAAWSSQPAGAGGPRSLWSVACPTTSYCATVDGIDGDVVSWNPAAGSPLTTHRLPIDAYGIWCGSTTLCLASGEGVSNSAELVGSIDPSLKSPAWNATDFGDINAVSCPTSSICLAADNQGQVMSGVTVSGLATTLRREAIARIPSIGTLLHRRGYATRVTAPISGQLQVQWRTGGQSSPLLATTSARFTGAQTRLIHLSLTPTGRTLLRATRLAITATAVYQTNTGAVTAQRRVTLRAR